MNTPRAAIFPDCCFPENCECAQRGYEHERESCAWPVVRKWAVEFGLDPDRLVKTDRFLPKDDKR